MAASAFAATVKVASLGLLPLSDNKVVMIASICDALQQPLHLWQHFVLADPEPLGLRETLVLELGMQDLFPFHRVWAIPRPDGSGSATDLKLTGSASPVFCHADLVQPCLVVTDQVDALAVSRNGGSQVVVDG